jgi:hypothetical protein
MFFKVMFEHVSTRGSCVDPHDVTPVEGFTKFGQGFCLDAANQWYSSVASSPLPLSTTDAYCLEWCSPNLHRDLVAVEIYHDNVAASTFCYCSFSGGAVPNDIKLSDYTPAASRTVAYPGVGAIKSTDATTSAVCYQNMVSLGVAWYFAYILCFLSPQIIPPSIVSEELQ